MRVSIWDLDYTSASDKTNVINPDIMRIASYHEQRGDKITFVTSEDDIRRAFDLYYIVKNKHESANPPVDFFLMHNIRWWGDAFYNRINWKMPIEMMEVRPDYLLYPNRDTDVERAEYIRLFDDKSKLLPAVQDWSNTFKKKYSIECDTTMWYADEKSILKALGILAASKKLVFYEPIWIQKIMSYKSIRDAFFKLDFKNGQLIKFLPITLDKLPECVEFLKEFKLAYPRVAMPKLEIDCWNHISLHWQDKECALKDLNNIKNAIIECKKEKITMEIPSIKNRFDTPYFFLFDEIANWTQKSFREPWIKYLYIKYAAKSDKQLIGFYNYLSEPPSWNELFRDLLRQTYSDEEFIIAGWGDKNLTREIVPWPILKEEFKNGL